MPAPDNRLPRAISDAEASDIAKELRLAAARVCEDNAPPLSARCPQRVREFSQISAWDAAVVLREAAVLLRGLK